MQRVGSCLESRSRTTGGVELSARKDAVLREFLGRCGGDQLWGGDNRRVGTLCLGAAPRSEVADGNGRMRDFEETLFGESDLPHRSRRSGSVSGKTPGRESPMACCP